MNCLTGWEPVFNFNFVGIDDYYTPCSGLMYLYANIYEDDLTEITTPTYTGLNSGVITITYNLKIIDYNTEEPVVGDFGSIETLYSIDNGTTWQTMGTVNSSTFTPTNDCQLLTYTIAAGTTSSSSNFKVKFNFTYNSGDWEVVLDDFKVQQAATSSVSNLDLSSLSVYPNPVSDMLNINYNENITKLTIYDVAGRSVKSIATNNSMNSINVSDLKSGTYLLSIETESKNASTIKFIKK